MRGFPLNYLNFYDLRLEGSLSWSRIYSGVFPSCSFCSSHVFYPVISIVFSFLSFTLNFPLHFFLKLRLGLRLPLLELWRLLFFFLWSLSLLGELDDDLPLGFAALFLLYIFCFGINGQSVLAFHIRSILTCDLIIT